ncbi:MAG: DUF421 domain-containing protein [Cellulosilyticum sp.]|nr:DUF421 domain-containing protein [Cellulosilyticum sp.]
MQIPFLLRPVILFIMAVILIRLTGRRSISQMTIAQTVLMISIGAIIVEPFSDKDIRKTAIAAIIFVILLILFEFCSFYSKSFKKCFVGEPKMIIRQGKFDEVQLRKLRLTQEEVMSRLRQIGITQITDIEEGILESNGELGYKLTKEAQPLKRGEFMELLSELLDEEAKEKLQKKINTL